MRNYVQKKIFLNKLETIVDNSYSKNVTRGTYLISFLLNLKFTFQV